MLDGGGGRHLPEGHEAGLGPQDYEATLRDQTLPLPADATKALLALQEVSNPDFRKKWKLKDTAESETAREESVAEEEEAITETERADESELPLIWEDFRESCTYEEHLKMIALGMGSPVES